MVERKDYLAQLNSWKNEKVIKVVTGIRRCGKSTLLMQYQKFLEREGVPKDRIVSINLEELENEELLDYRKLYSFIKTRLVDDEMTYVFLDEIQRVDDFQLVVDSLYVKDNVDLYITGSNAYLLSGELATFLTGRYVEISMLPLSFGEFVEINDASNIESCFADYLKYGGLPYISDMDRTDEKVNTYLEGIYNTVIIKDIEDRYSRGRNGGSDRRITDVTLLKTIALYLSSVVGSPVSLKRITDYLVSSGRRVSQNTVAEYVEALVEPFLFYHCQRFDISGKQLLKTNGKYYMVDLGLRNHVLAKRRYDLGFSIENVVYLELIRRGYLVNVGKAGDSEVDFVVRKKDYCAYIQVTADMTSEETFEREVRPLRRLSDNYRKLVLTLDRFSSGNYEGIEVLNVMDWLLER